MGRRNYSLLIDFGLRDIWGVIVDTRFIFLPVYLFTNENLCGIAARIVGIRGFIFHQLWRRQDFCIDDIDFSHMKGKASSVFFSTVALVLQHKHLILQFAAPFCSQTVFHRRGYSHKAPNNEPELSYWCQRKSRHCTLSQHNGKHPFTLATQRRHCKTLILSCVLLKVKSIWMDASIAALLFLVRIVFTKVASLHCQLQNKSQGLCCQHLCQSHEEQSLTCWLNFDVQRKWQ